MTANPGHDPARSRDLARLRELTRPHRHYGPLIQQVLPHMTPGDFEETLAILERISGPDESVPA